MKTTTASQHYTPDISYQNNQNPLIKANAMESRRKSTVHVSSSKREKSSDLSAHIELERLEQETTLVLQEIDRNLSQANAVITEKVLPILSRYHSALSSVWNNVSFWKKFVEEASETKICPEESHVEGASAQDGEQTGKLKLSESASSKKNVLKDLELLQNSTLTSELQMEASTPQLRSRHLLQPSTSPQRSANRNYARVLISPRKRSSRYDADGARRLSMLQNFLNSSPTLPEPPKLTSEINYNNAPSSSNAPRSGHSDPDHNAALRLLSVLLLPAEITPDGRLRFPRTPLGSSANRLRDSAIPSLQRAKEVLDQVLPIPPLSAVDAGDDSDQVPLPQLKTILVGTSAQHSPGPRKETPSKRRRTEGDESENVFLDSNYKDDTNNNSRSHSVVYNTIKGQSGTQNEEEGGSGEIEGGEHKSKSVSEIFENVLNSPDKDEIAREEAKEQKAAGDDSDLATHVSRNLDHTTDSTVNSSELGSVLGERWRAISKTLKKSG